MSNNKGLKIFCFVMSVLCVIGGISSNTVSDGYKGIGYKSGYMINGTFHTLNEGTIGGNSEAVSHYSGLATLFFIGAVVFFIAALVIKTEKTEISPIELTALQQSSDEIIGTILSKSRDSLIVSLPDGSKKGYKFSTNDVKTLIAGDTRIFYIKGDKIVAVKDNNQFS